MNDLSLCSCVQFVDTCQVYDLCILGTVSLEYYLTMKEDINIQKNVIINKT